MKSHTRACTKDYVLLFVGWFTLFLCQCAVPSTSSYLQTTAGLSMQDIGNLLSCFAFTYALTKLASGFLYDNLHFNPKHLFCSGLAVGGLLCLCFPPATAASTYLGCLLKLIEGVFQGFGWPACAQLLKQWYPPSDIGVKYSLLSAGANLAGSTAPLISTYLATKLGWQYCYYILGSSCVLVAIIVAVNMECSLNQRHRSSNADTREESTYQTPVLPWHSVFLFKEFWLVTALSVTLWVVRSSIIDWIQLYVTEHLKYPNITAARCGAVMEIAAIVGKLSFGFISDKLLKWRVMVRKGLCPRAYLLLVLTVLSALFSYLYTVYITPDTSELWLTVVCFGCGVSIGALVGMCSLSLMESVPPALSATALGMGDCTAHLVGRCLLGYTVFSSVATHPNWGWSAGYMMVDTLALAAVVTALLLVTSTSTPTPSIATHDKDK